MTHVRPIVAADLDVLAAQRHALWPDGSVEQHRAELRAFLDGKPVSTLPFTVLVACDGDAISGFVEVGLRSHADGCDPRHPVGFLEGWYVTGAAPDRDRRCARRRRGGVVRRARMSGDRLGHLDRRGGITARAPGARLCDRRPLRPLQEAAALA
jgi:hypothetical protein